MIIAVSRVLSDWIPAFAGMTEVVDQGQSGRVDTCGQCPYIGAKPELEDGMYDAEMVRYLFDLQGYVVLEDVLGPDEVRELNGLIDAQDLPEPSLKRSGVNFGGSGAGKESAGFLEWGKPFCDLLDHPKVMPALRIVLGDGFRLDHLYGIHMRSGSEGLSLHGGAVPHNPTEVFYFEQGRMYNGLTVVSWNLVDTGPEYGGFLCIPGSHKSNYAVPDQVMAAHDGAACVVVPEVRAGSVVIFTEALSHGTAQWKAPYMRRSLLFKYDPSYMAYSRRQAAAPKNVELTSKQKWLFEPPSHSTSFGRPTLFEETVPEP